MGRRRNQDVNGPITWQCLGNQRLYESVFAIDLGRPNGLPLEEK
jgi:hypothetical protein